MDGKIGQIACADALSRRLGVGVLAILLPVSVAGLSRAGTPEAGAATGTGFRDFSFGEPNTLQPTRDKPQSKLWFANGSWWGVLFDRGAEEYRIHRYNWDTHTWTDTGTLVDARNDSKADALWDGTHLYISLCGYERGEQRRQRARDALHL